MMWGLYSDPDSNKTATNTFGDDAGSLNGYFRHSGNCTGGVLIQGRAVTPVCIPSGICSLTE